MDYSTHKPHNNGLPHQSWIPLFTEFPPTIVWNHQPPFCASSSSLGSTQAPRSCTSHFRKMIEINKMKEFVKIDATTFLMLKSPPPKAPHVPLGHVWWHRHGMFFMQIPCHVIHGHDATVMARHPVFRHDMSYMDMPWSWHVMPCSHLMWPWHGKLHMKQVMLPTHFQPFISWRLVSKLLSVSKSWPPLYPCGENVKRWNLQWHWTLPHFWILLPSTALLGQLPSHLGAIKLWGPIPPSSFFYRFLDFFLEVSLIRELIFLLWHSCGGRTVG